ncbi:DNA polymerase alpha catalytic subunit [Tribolium castaneum]|nr:PREDICTED: DNA polymerase alpha catalytic subunit [Tribolium castaneum]|eukprot:XP_967510.2 PREDICTED: DNA polymerase alpha catalytic subunit [Tribolium castaneum]
MEDDTSERRPKRQKRDSSYKAKAFEKFKQLKSGLRNKYEVEELENVYDTVDEKEYTKKVLDRQDDDWIVDDDGSGYVEDGRDIFDDDLDHASIAAASSKKNKGVKRKKNVAENAGRGNLQYLISNMPSKKKEEKKLDQDDDLAELLQEINETPRESKAATSNFSPLSVKQAEKDYMRKLTSIKKPVITLSRTPKAKQPLKISTEENHAKPTEETILTENKLEPEITQASCEEIAETQASCEEVAETQSDGCFDDDLDLSQLEESEAEQSKPQIEEKQDLWENIESEMLKEWSVSQDTETTIDLQNSDIPLVKIDDKSVFRFFWWDAYEDPFIKPGVVVLFGKTYHTQTKTHVSCTVIIRNIDRRIFFLPRVEEEKSKKPVTSQDVYAEINELMKTKGIKNFKARPVTKKYAFDLEVPSESDYVEVRYAATDPPIDKTTKGRTFSRVFGSESSYLEIFLLDRKIKGPCWLNIANPIPESNPSTWCKLQVNCDKLTDVTICEEAIEPPPLVVTALNMRRAFNPKTGLNEIVMLSLVTNVSYSVDKQAPTEAFQKHCCVFYCPDTQVLSSDLFTVMQDCKITTLQKMHSEKALLNYFITQFSKLDSDIVVGHDLQGHQISVLAERMFRHKIPNFSKLGRIKKSTFSRHKIEKELFVGRLVCDVKTAAKELIRCRSYDLGSLCQAVLKIKDEQRTDLEPDDVLKMFRSKEELLKLVSLTMQDTAFVLKIMYSLNIIPLALQITTIAGNVMSKTLMGGRSERNEFLLLHAFSEKNYIVPDKSSGKKDFGEKTANKKATYSGGLVLDPKIGFYDKFILLMDFNSLYPSIIQEYNICFTTMPPNLAEDNMVLPDATLPAGVLPTEIKKLVESRRAVKKLMKSADLSPDQRMQYDIRQMALKLTANSMYGCLGFANSRFYAKNLAALITHKGREILTNTKEVVERLNFEVIYGDTDSLMINTNLVDFDQVAQIGTKIKQEINKLYRQVELDIDGVFKYLLLLKKKKYAAVTLSKDKEGRLKTDIEYKGLDIVRRDWSRLAAEAGKFVLNQILSDQSSENRFLNILTHLSQLREDLQEGKVPLSLLVITKQLSKNPDQYPEDNTLPHVQVAIRYNKQGGHYRAGDTVPYLICDDGTKNPATQRAYHIEELKNSETLKIDVTYYLANQIHPVVSRICEPIEALDLVQISDCLGVDSSNLRKVKVDDDNGENVIDPEIKFRNVDKFVFKCLVCESENTVDGPFSNNIPVLQKCQNARCKARPADYVPFIQNQMTETINSYIEKFYLNEMYCEDPMCCKETVRIPLSSSGRVPFCQVCNSVLIKKYSGLSLFTQITYFQYIFDLTKLSKMPSLELQVEKAYHEIKETVERRYEFCGFSTVKMENMFAWCEHRKKEQEDEEIPDFAMEESLLNLMLEDE